MFGRFVAVAGHRFGDNHPRIVVAENAGVLLIARRVRRDLAQLQVVARVRRLLQDDAVRRGQALAHRIERLPRQAVLIPMPARMQKPCGSMKIFPSAHSLGPDLFAEIVVSAQEPFAVPAVRAHRLFHARAFGQA
jgi:hypothetical protein